MATATQIKALIRSHFDNDSERFSSISLQVAASEAKLGHGSFALDIRNMVEEERKKVKSKFIPFNSNLSELVAETFPEIYKSSLVISETLEERIQRIIHEYRQRNKLKSHGLEHRRKLMLIGTPGTGKTMTAKVLAHELSLPLYTVQLDKLVTKFMGETSIKLRLIFDSMLENHGIYFFDEFDTIGGERSFDNDVGEMRRILNAFLQFIEQDTSESLILTATNNPQLLDNALFRRFDDILRYNTPTYEERKSLIFNVLTTFICNDLSWNKVLEISEGLCHAEIDVACRDTIKNAILSDKKKIAENELLENLRYRHEARKESAREINA